MGHGHEHDAHHSMHRVVAVEPAGRTKLPNGVRTVDGRGKYLIPGLLDMHVHLMASGKPTEIEMPMLVAHGVTGVRVMDSDRPNAKPTEPPGLAQHRDWQARIASGTLVGPRLLALATWAIEALTALIEAGADLTLATASGVTPRAMAQRRGNQAAVKLLESARKP